jgi:hypothetical protein
VSEPGSRSRIRVGKAILAPGSLTAPALISKELTFRQAALALGRTDDPSGRLLRELVQAREQQTRKLIAVRLRGRKHPKLKVTLGALYRAFPELRPARVDALEATVRALLARVDERTAVLVHGVINDTVEPRLKRLEKQANAAEAYLRTLAENDTERHGTNSRRRNG